jgi:hypothetical protein
MSPLVSGLFFEQGTVEAWSTLAEGAAAELSAVHFKRIGELWDLVEIHAALARFNERDIVGRNPDAFGNIFLRPVQIAAAVADEVTEGARKTSRHEVSCSGSLAEGAAAVVTKAVGEFRGARWADESIRFNISLICHRKQSYYSPV